MLYKRVYESLRLAITNGTYPVGERLPSEAELSKQFDVSAITVKRALELLRSEGMIMRRPRIGTVVTSATATTVPAAGSEVSTRLLGCVLTSFDDTFGNKIIEGILAAAGADTHVIFKRSGGDLAEEDACIRSLVDAGVEGLVLLPSSSEYIPPAALELVARRFPLVILDRLFDGIPVSAVCSDNLGGGRAHAVGRPGPLPRRMAFPPPGPLCRSQHRRRPPDPATVAGVGDRRLACPLADRRRG